MPQHTEHCRSNGIPCWDEFLAQSYWDQPERYYVDEAIEVLGDSARWCAVAELAGRIQRNAERAESQHLKRQVKA